MTKWPEDIGQKILIKMHRRNEKGEIEKKPWKELEDASPEVLRRRLGEVYQDGIQGLRRSQQRSS